jgi:hypothetical protein
MNILPFFKERPSSLAAALTAFVLWSDVSRAATLVVSGRLEGDSHHLFLRGDTMDYYKFEVTTGSTLRVEIEPFYAGFLFQLAAYIGLDSEFASVGNPYRIYPPGREGNPQFLERHLDPGQYVVATSAGGRSSYDIFDGYKAVNPEGGGFPSAEYRYTITGNVRGLEYWDGHLDGTFTVTSIPEPGTASLIGGGALLLCNRNAHTRKQNKALLPTPRGWVVFMRSVARKVSGFIKALSRP